MLSFVANVLDGDIIMSSHSSPAIMFSFCGAPHGVVADVLDCDIIVIELEL